MQDLLNAQQEAFNRSCVGDIIPVLFDRPGRHEGQLVGRSPYMQPVHVEGPSSMLGQIAELKIEAGYANSLAGSWPADDRNLIDGRAFA